ncbi:hypothetical protein ACFQ4Z_02965 [Oceanobacillus oncorhynchi subsp. oncorhynchi]|uniref:hypothetical protein n=1 Tax=Oceanobacillus oncorhynchi TaxID=545501 RepID=UPI0031E23412
MKKKWLAVVPAVTVALVGAPHFNQTVDAAPENGSVQQAESEIPAGYQAELFTVETAVAYAEKALDNDDLVFSSNGELHRDSDGKVFYSLKAQSQDLIDNGGTGTVGFYDVYQNGDVVESKPR